MARLVERDEFGRVARQAGAVEDAADDDGVVGRVVVAEAPAGVVAAPGKLRAPHESVGEPAVGGAEDFFQVVGLARGGAGGRSAPALSDPTRFVGNAGC